MGYLGLVHLLLLQLAQAVPLRGLVSGRLGQLGVAIGKHRLMVLELLLLLLQLLGVGSLLLAESFQFTLLLITALLGGHCVG